MASRSPQVGAWASGCVPPAREDLDESEQPADGRALLADASYLGCAPGDGAFRRSRGLAPKVALKARVKPLRSPKPQRNAIAETGRSASRGSSRSRRHLSSRRPLMYADTDWC